MFNIGIFPTSLNEKQTTVAFPTQRKKSRCNKSHILLCNVLCTLCCTYTISNFHVFDLKHLLSKTFFQIEFLDLAIFMSMYLLILVTSAVAVKYFFWISELGHAKVSSLVQ